METYEVAVVGGGVAGYSAALTLKSLNMRTLWLAERWGGLIRRAEQVRNYPAVQGTGEQFFGMLEAQRQAEDIPFVRARADGIFKTGDGYLISAGKESYLSRAVILCTGVERGGGIAGEERFLGHGVSYCAVCDGALYRGKDIAAVLYSEEFCGEAEYLAGYARTVHVFCLFPAPTFQAENIVVHAERPRAVEGEERVARLAWAGGGVEVKGVFLLKRSAPPEALVGGLAAEGAHVKVARDLSTNLEGLFAAGDVTGTPYQFAKAAGEGCVAAYSAKAYLARLKNFER